MQTNNIVKNSVTGKKEEVKLNNIYILVEIDVEKNSTKILQVSDSFEDSEVYLLDYIGDAEDENSPNQFVIENKYRINLYKRGYLFGKSLSRVYEIQKYVF